MFRRDGPGLRGGTGAAGGTRCAGPVVCSVPLIKLVLSGHGVVAPGAAGTGAEGAGSPGAGRGCVCSSVPASGGGAAAGTGEGRGWRRGERSSEMAAHSHDVTVTERELHAGRKSAVPSGSPRKHHRALPARRRAAAGRGRSLLALEDPRGGRERVSAGTGRAGDGTGRAATGNGPASPPRLPPQRPPLPRAGLSRRRAPPPPGLLRACGEVAMATRRGGRDPAALPVRPGWARPGGAVPGRTPLGAGPGGARGSPAGPGRPR